MIESINWPLEDVMHATFLSLTDHLPTFASQLVHLNFVSNTILPFLHKVVLLPAVNEFSTFEKKLVVNDKGSEPFAGHSKGLPFVAEGSQ
jgi:hypothetical protein